MLQKQPSEFFLKLLFTRSKKNSLIIQSNFTLCGCIFKKRLPKIFWFHENHVNPEISVIRFSWHFEIYDLQEPLPVSISEYTE